MRRKWLALFAGLAIVAAGCLFAGNAEAKYAESKSLTLTVSIEKHYEVAFDANGGTGTMANQEFTVGVQQALTRNEYTYAEHYFDGWNTEIDGTGTSYADEELITTDLTNIGGDTITLYAQWTEEAMRTVFNIDGDCVFHGYELETGQGDGYITGTNCSVGGTDWADGTHKYIDTGINLYDSTNYEKDYEVGFTIVAYDSDHQYIERPLDTASQVTFFSAKFEDANRHWPGIAIRKNSNKIDVTQTIKIGNTYEKKTKNDVASSITKIVVTRVDGVVYCSFNGGEFQLLQNMQNTTDYFNVSATFGAAKKSDGTPMRFVDATLTDIYIKIGDTGANQHTVSFDAGGYVADPADVTTISSFSKLGSSLPSMPSYVDTDEGRLYFQGWFTGTNGAGDKYTEDSVIDHNLTLHAFWNASYVLCRVADAYYGTIQECITAAASNPSTNTIIFYDDFAEQQVGIASGQEIIFDLNGYTWSNYSNTVLGKPLLENSGKVTIMNGTMTSSRNAGVIDNKSTGELHIDNGARIVATGPKQAVYNTGGKVFINDGAYLSATSTSGTRATVHSLNNGQVTITGGTIIAVKQEAVKIESGTLTIGVEDGVIDSTAPVIQGATNGITTMVTSGVNNTSVTISMFDGVLRGKSAAIDDASRITATESDATAVGINPVETETIDGVVYKVLYYQ